MVGAQYAAVIGDNGFQSPHRTRRVPRLIEPRGEIVLRRQGVRVVGAERPYIGPCKRTWR